MAKTLLLVEYEPRYIERVQGYLAGKSIEVRVAKNGEEALDYCRASSRPDLILISSVLPKMRTPEVLRELHQLEGADRIPILLMVSGYRGKDRKADAEKAGAFDILEKPFDEDAFFAKLGQVLPASELGRASVPPPAAQSGQSLTSNQIFGDVLGDVGSSTEQRTEKVRMPTMAAEDDVDRRLEQTLSGIMPTTGGKRKTGSNPVPEARPSAEISLSDLAPKAPTKRPTRQVAAPNVDALLSETLSGLDITGTGTGRRMKRDSIPPGSAVAVPEIATPPPVPVADAPKPAPVAEAPKPAPVAEAPKPTPVVEAPKPTPVAEAPKPAPVAEAPKPAPVAETPKPAPVVEAPKPPPPPERPAPPAPAPAARPKPLAEPTPTESVEFGKYVLLEKIATGGMAEVYKARMRGVEGFQKIVAIKRILPHMSDNEDFVTMFMDEAKLAAQLTHGNIVHIYDLDRIGDSYYIAMEYIDGRDLRSILREAFEKSFTMPVALVLLIASRVASALDHAHSKRDFDGKELNLVHRDVSPQNILISRQGEIKLCDFGIAKAAVKSSHTQSGALKGKLQYMSPEQAWGRNLDRRSDIFSLGVVMWEMLCGRKLFMGDTELSILEQVREGRVEPPSNYNSAVTAEIDRIVLKSLAKDPKDRYDFAAEMERDIEEVLHAFRPAPGPMDVRAYVDQLGRTQPELAENPFEKALAVAVEESKPGLAVLEEEPAIDDDVVAPPAVVVPSVEPARPHPPPSASAAEPAKAEAEKVEALSGTVPPAESTPSEAPPAKGKGGLFAALGIAAIVVFGVGGYFLFKGKGSTPENPTTPATSTSAPETPGTTTPPTGTETPSTETAAPESSQVQEAIDAEVARQVEERRKKLEEQMAKEAEAARQAAEKANEPKPAPKPEPPKPEPAATKPAEPPKEAPAPKEPAEATTPAGEDGQPAATETPAPETPAPKPVEPAPPKEPEVKIGDLVGPGEGVVPPDFVSAPTPSYPPIAKRQRIEGTVVIMALVDENGNVTTTRVIRGHSALNDAALDAIKKAKFKPATKNGVRVKMWKTIEVPFRL